MRVLVVTAVAAEAESVAAGLAAGAGSSAGSSAGSGSGHGARAETLIAGVGPAAAAAATATALASSADDPYGLVVSAGIGGGFPHRAPVGSLVVADAIVAADLGADGPDGFLSVEELGFGRAVHLPPAGLAARAAEAAGALCAPVLTVSTVTGTAARAAELSGRHPRAAAEAMEGFGVAEAAAVHGVPVLEIRAISNPVGPRDRAAWRIGDALNALRDGFQRLGPLLADPFADDTGDLPAGNPLFEESP
ncbi:futalosine hydrolase [Streptomyces jumonjinensis]|uniref:Futalosine hydrolase n=1 Tax=Streptomyces jumonjinensis TaxID=1945 RepID=A0A646KPP5_STRJU|nr:futalosine hydrolase [Streptomyces jumonjinensis]MQT04294.1 futalosine hydrolase [Streptomyces jumonjinensis]